jgi:hypothetical protein
MNSSTHIPPVPVVPRAICLFLMGTAFLNSARAEEPYVLWATTAAALGSSSQLALTPAGEVLMLSYSYPAYLNNLIKFDRVGNMVSSNVATSLPGQMTSTRGIAVDAIGATYLAGLGGPNGGNAFSVVKLNAAGELAWVSRESNPLPGAPNYANALAPDAQGNLLVGGISQGPITLGPFQFGEGSGPVLCKYDPAGQVLWAKRIEHHRTSGNTSVYFHDLAVDSAGNIVISGYLAGGTADFGGTTVSPGATQPDNWGDGFIAKYDPNGSLLWVRLAQVAGTVGMSIAVDRQGNTYFLESSFRFGKLNPNGELLWAKQFSGSWLSQRQGIALDAADEPVFTGEIDGTVQFDDIVLHSQTSTFQDFFVAKADGDGNIQWAMRGGGPEFDSGEQVICDKLGNIFLGAVIRKNVGSFDGITLTPANAGTGYTTIMLAKISPMPWMTIGKSTGSVTVTWPAKATNYVLEASSPLAGDGWTSVEGTPVVSGRAKRLTLSINSDAKFFCLRKQ